MNRNEIESKFKNLTLSNSGFFSDKSFKYDTIFFVTKFLYDFLYTNDNGYYFDVSDNNMKQIVLKIAKRFNLPKSDGNADTPSNRNYVKETLKFLLFINSIKETDDNHYQIIDKSMLDFIVVSIENTYIIQFLVAKMTFINDGIYEKYLNYLSIEKEYRTKNNININVDIFQDIKEEKEKALLLIRDEIVSRSSSVRSDDTYWSYNTTKFPIMVLSLANNDFKISRTLNISNDRVTPKLLSANVEGTRSIMEKDNDYIEDFNLDYVKEFLDNDSVNNKTININNNSRIKQLTVEYVKENAVKFANLDKEMEPIYEGFRDKFGPDKLKQINGEELLNSLFYHDKDRNNMSYLLENKIPFGGIGGGSAQKFGLYKKLDDGKWYTGPKNVLTDEEAIEKAEIIRDGIIAGCELVKQKKDKLSTEGDYVNLYDELLNATNNYSRFVSYRKYFHIMFPNVFPPYYNKEFTKLVLDNAGIDYIDDYKHRYGLIQIFINKCEVSDIVFDAVFREFLEKYNNINLDDEDILEENEEMGKLNIFDIKRESLKGNNVNRLNLIVYGAPGTSKTYNMPNYAIAAIDNANIDLNKDRATLLKRYKELVKNGQIVFTTFHQNYGYEDFIEGLRPDPNSTQLSFKTVDGIFKKIADKAIQDNNNRYVIIIDEINRGNISKIFGELITLIEEDKRWGEENEMSATLPSGRPFAVPNNLYIIGTMNSADKSISLIDAALRRRFDFEEMTPNASLIEDKSLKKIFEKLNNCLSKALDSSDLLIGHSYFINKTIDDIETIMNNRIIPLLYEYFYDNKNKVRNIIEEALGEQYVSIVDNDYGRLRIKKS